MTGESAALPRAAVRGLVGAALVASALLAPASVAGASAAVTAPATAPARASAIPTPRHVLAARIAQSASLHAPAAALRGTAIPLTGAVRPARAGVQVSLQRAGHDGWSTVATAITRSDGTYRVADRPMAGTVARYRVVVPSTSRFSATTSRVHKVHLRTSGVHYVLRPGSVRLPASAIVQVVVDAARTIELAPGVTAPPVGSVVLAPPVAGAPEGVVDLVTGRSLADGHWSLTTRTAALGDAFRDFTLTQHLVGLVEASEVLGPPVWRCPFDDPGPAELPTFSAPHLAVDIVVDVASGASSVTVTGDQVTTWGTGHAIEFCSAVWPDAHRVLTTVAGVPVAVRSGVQVYPLVPAGMPGAITTRAALHYTTETRTDGVTSVTGGARVTVPTTTVSNGFRGIAWDLWSGVGVTVSMAAVTVAAASTAYDVTDHVIDWTAVPLCHRIDAVVLALPGSPRQTVSDTCVPPSDSPGVTLTLSPLSGKAGFVMSGELVCPAVSTGTPFWLVYDEGRLGDSGDVGTLESDGRWHFPLSITAPTDVGEHHWVFACEDMVDGGALLTSDVHSHGVTVTVTG